MPNIRHSRSKTQHNSPLKKQEVEYITPKEDLKNIWDKDSDEEDV